MLSHRALSAFALFVLAAPAAANPPPSPEPNIWLSELNLDEAPGDLRETLTSEGLREALLGALDGGPLQSVHVGDVLFPSDDREEARFLLGARLDGWKEESSAGCEAVVYWELYDHGAATVVYTGNTRGVANEYEDADCLRGALIDATHKLAQRPALLAAVGRPLRPPPDWEAPLGVASCAQAPEALPAGLPHALAATVTLKGENGSGSGVFLSTDGFVATAAHVVADNPELMAITAEGLGLPAVVVRLDRAFDVALVKVEGEGFSCLPMAAALPAVGAEIYGIGSPSGEALATTATRGIVSGTRTWGERVFLQTDASISPGASGGPLLRPDGQVVAIISWKLAGGALEGLGFGVPVSTLTERLGVSQGGAHSAALVADARVEATPRVVDLSVEQETAARAEVARASAPRSSGGGGGRALFGGTLLVGGALYTLWAADNAETAPGLQLGLGVASTLTGALILFSPTGRDTGAQVGLSGGPGTLHLSLHGAF